MAFYCNAKSTTELSPFLPSPLGEGELLSWRSERKLLCTLLVFHNIRFFQRFVLTVQQSFVASAKCQPNERVKEMRKRRRGQQKTRALQWNMRREWTLDLASLKEKSEVILTQDLPMDHLEHTNANERSLMLCILDLLSASLLRRPFLYLGMKLYFVDEEWAWWCAAHTILYPWRKYDWQFSNPLSNFTYQVPRHLSTN